MSPLLIKGLMGVGGLGIGGIGAWQIHEHIRPRTLRQKMESQGLIFRAFDEKNLAEWKTMALQHKNDANGNGAQKIKFEGLNITNTSENDEDGKKLLNKCREVSSLLLGEADEEKNIKRLKEWCVVSSSNTVTVPTASVTK